MEIAKRGCRVDYIAATDGSWGDEGCFEFSLRGERACLNGLKWLQGNADLAVAASGGAEAGAVVVSQNSEPRCLDSKRKPQHHDDDVRDS